MIEMTYDPEADAVYMHLGRGKVASTEEAGPFIYDLDADGRVLGIEILSASTVLAAGEWTKARLPGQTKFDAAE